MKERKRMETNFNKTQDLETGPSFTCEKKPHTKIPTASDHFFGFQISW